MKRFALIGAGGYIAPRHLNAIRETGNQLICAMDPSDSVGILDRYFPECDFFTEFERFDRHAEKLRHMGAHKRIEWVSICSPNHLHDAHIRFALRLGTDVICEKPVVLNPWNVDALQDLEKETGKRVNVVFQLRLHSAIQSLREQILNMNQSEKHDIELTYITGRGIWYDYSWKGDIRKSGGIATNIGIHFFDMLIWIFGAVQHSEIHVMEHRRAAGFLELKNARIKWYLSLNRSDLPESVNQENQSTYRLITIDGRPLEFSEGFTDLHTLLYEKAIAGKGYTLEDARPSIELVQKMRCADVVNCDSEKKHRMLLEE
ncbi:Gfo/Idh/MocA family oxidoreductase [bacterium]|nr:Gfo/Idh/MocA family oxidoreductase [bacterium]